jgi:acyl-CoA synthetase (AMP-forming)/AMP-acid ligase II
MDGELYVTGRLKDLIILEGRNLYPQDIERVVESAHSRMRSGCSAAFPVDHEDRERLVVVAEVDERPAPDGENPPSFEGILREIRTALTRELSVGVFRVVLLRSGKIPKTSSGKIQRHACKARFQEGSLEFLATA